MNSPRTVLVIDDDEGTTHAFAQLLRLEGFHVRTAPSAERGLQEVESAPPDAIIVDLRMPFVNGLGFLYRLRLRHPHRNIPVALMTGDHALDDDVSEEIAQLGVQLHFKPLWLEDVLAIANALTAGRSAPGLPLSLPN